MKLVKLAWVLGGISAMGLGMAAQACSSSSGNGSTGSSSSVTTGTNCATLSACCPKLSGANLSACSMLVGDANDSACATYLAEIPTGTCSGTTSSGTSSTTTITTSGGSSSTAPGGGSSGTGTSAGSSTSCETAPKLYTESSAGVYCPYSGVDGGKAQTCAAGDHCCEPSEGDAGKSAPSTCEPAATACTTGAVNWECLEAIDCASSSAGKVCCGTGTTVAVPACGSQPAFAYVDNFTGTSCAASCSTYVICEQDSDCPGGAAGSCVPTKAKGNDFGHCVGSGS